MQNHPNDLNKLQQYLTQKVEKPNEMSFLATKASVDPKNELAKNDAKKRNLNELVMEKIKLKNAAK